MRVVEEFGAELAGAALLAEVCAETKMVKTQKSARQLTISRAGNPAVFRAIFMRIPSLENQPSSCVFQVERTADYFCVLKGHDRGTLWVACRKCAKMNVGFSP